MVTSFEVVAVIRHDSGTSEVKYGYAFKTHQDADAFRTWLYSSAKPPKIVGISGSYTIYDGQLNYDYLVAIEVREK